MSSTRVEESVRDFWDEAFKPYVNLMVIRENVIKQEDKRFSGVIKGIFICSSLKFRK